MSKYREISCESYICAGKCAKGYKNAMLSGRCQTCEKYIPRKKGNPVIESVYTKREKSRNKDLKRQFKEY